MPKLTSLPDPLPQSARALSLPPVVRSCPICGTPLTGRQKACSGKCRAALSRRKRIPVKAEDLRDLWGLAKETIGRVSEIKADATAMLERLWEAKVSLEKYLNRA